MKCPGVDPRFLKAETRNCPSCGHAVEIFSDEVRVKCFNCKEYVYRKNLPSCLDWCKYASSCRGIMPDIKRKEKEAEEPRDKGTGRIK
ncbi:MAG: phosphohydrolase [Candidatus Omnitrophica bacterium]|nr:phosphohydrolase [Candidatus Omnitrophota bacterium]